MMGTIAARVRRCALQCALALVLTAPVLAWGANACIAPDSPGEDAPRSGGIGGTGAPDASDAADDGAGPSAPRRGGTGGTGASAQEGGTGGTGATAQRGGTGGTGAVASGGTGGTGATAQQGGTGGTGATAQQGGTGGTGATAQQGGTGGTGATAQQGGTGGTGSVATGGTGGTGAVASGGIGGTGKQADTGGMGGTGIVGVITGFASVCVNGIEVHIDAKTQVTRNGAPAGPRDLAVGHFVSIETAPGRMGMRAARIAMLDAAVGPVTRVGKNLEVLGQSVRISSETLGAAGGLKVGDRVRVSGPRTADNTVVATRVERADSPVDSVSGPATTSFTGALRIAGVGIAGTRGSADVKGREVLAVGRWDGSKLVAERIDSEPATSFRSPVRNLVLEGFPTPGSKRDRIRVAGKEVELRGETATAVAGARDRLVRITGRVGEDGVVRATRVEARRELLPRGERGLRSVPGDLDRSDGGGREDGKDGASQERSGDSKSDGRESGSGRSDEGGGKGDSSRGSSGGSDSERSSGGGSDSERSSSGSSGGSDSERPSSGSSGSSGSERSSGGGSSGDTRSSGSSSQESARSTSGGDRSSSGGSRDRVERSSGGGSRDKVERSSSGSGRERSRDR